MASTVASYTVSGPMRVSGEARLAKQMTAYLLGVDLNTMATSIMSGMSMHGRCKACASTPAMLVALNRPPAIAPFAQEVMSAIGLLEQQHPGSGGDGICRVSGSPLMSDKRMHAGSA